MRPPTSPTLATRRDFLRVSATDAGARLVAMCDIFLDRVKGSREAIRNELAKQQRGDQVQVPDDRCFTGVDSYRQVIESCDAVLIANAAKFHPLQTMAAIQAGKHVFVEKPHGIDPAGVKLLESACALAKDQGLCVVSGLHRRYHTGKEITWEHITPSAFFFPPKPEDSRDAMAAPTQPGANGSYPVSIPGRTRLI